VNYGKSDKIPGLSLHDPRAESSKDRMAMTGADFLSFLSFNFFLEIHQPKPEAEPEKAE
jgi:hypothetical protein